MRTVTASYFYEQADGSPFARVDRVEPGTKGKKKDFYPYLFGDGAYATTPSRGGQTFPLYHLPEVLRAARNGGVIYLCEGEGKADALRARLPVDDPLSAVTNILGGSLQGFTLTQAAPFIGARGVAVLCDSDTPGREAAARRAATIARAAPEADVRVVDLFSDRDDGSDVADWLPEHSLEELGALIGAAARVEPAVIPPPKASSNGVAGDVLHKPKKEIPEGGYPSSGFELLPTLRSLFARLAGYNDPARLFVRDGKLARVADVAGVYRFEFLSGPMLELELARAEASFWNAKGTRVEAPKRLVDKMLVAQAMPFPSCDGFSYAPFFALDGERSRLFAASGFHSSARRFLAPNATSALIARDPIPHEREDFEVEVALAVAELDDLIFDFPLVGEPGRNASRANFFAYMLQDFVRPLIDGNTPLFLIDAAMSQTGKSLLAKVGAYASLGYEPAGMGWPTGNNANEEVGKTLIGLLAAGDPLIMFDNVTGRVRSAHLDSALTSRGGFRHRLLGMNTTPTYPVTQRFVMTANNPHLSSDLTNRTVLIELDAGRENPSDRTFRTPLILQYVRARQPIIARALLVLAANWVSLGCPEPRVRFGTYPEWAHVIGGILEAAGVRGLLENRRELRETVDADRNTTAEFFDACFAAFGSMPMPSRSERLVGIARAHGILDERNEKTSDLGAKLRGLRKQIAGGIRLRTVDAPGGGKSKAWVFEKVDAEGNVVENAPEVDSYAPDAPDAPAETSFFDD